MKFDNANWLSNTDKRLCPKTAMLKIGTRNTAEHTLAIFPRAGDMTVL